MQTHIEQILTKKFQPLVCSVIDESHLHAGHNEDAKKGGTHFKVFLVAQAFEGKKLIERHRLVYQALEEKGVTFHALAMTLKSQLEFSA